MNNLIDFNTLIQFIKANWAPLFVAAVLMPFALNLGAGVWRRICNRFSGYPTFAPGAVYRQCVSPSGGAFPELRCVGNGLLRVAMETPGGGKFFIDNRNIHDWVLPIVYDPFSRKDNAADSDCANFDRVDRELRADHQMPAADQGTPR